MSCVRRIHVFNLKSLSYHSEMKTKFTSFCQIFLLCSLFSIAAHADDPVDDSFDALMNEPLAGEISSEGTMGSSGQSLVLLTEDPKREQNAMYGWSIGFQTTSESYLANVDLYDRNRSQNSGPDTVTPLNYTNAGIIGRYAILPVDRFGSDFNVSFMQSTDSALTTLKGEINLAYTWGMSREFKIYMLGGLGVERLNGDEINKLITPSGGGAQIGMGLNFAALNFEALYSYYRFDIDKGQYAANHLSSSSMTFTKKKPYLEASGIVARASFNF